MSSALLSHLQSHVETQLQPRLQTQLQPQRAVAQTLHVGIDTVLVSRIEHSLREFGERFVARLFTAHEAEIASAVSGRRAERLAARFAAKEATLKAFDLCEAGIDWRDIEVRSDAAGRPHLALHGKAAERTREHGGMKISLSLSHDGDHACAVVVGLSNACDRPISTVPSV